MSDSSSNSSYSWTPFSQTAGGISVPPHDEPSELPVLSSYPHISNQNAAQMDTCAWQNNQPRVIHGEQIGRFHSEMNIEPEGYILNNQRFRETHAQSDSSYQIPHIYQRQQQQQQQPGFDYYSLQQQQYQQQQSYSFQDGEIMSYSSDMSGIYQYPPPPNTPQDVYAMYSASASSSPVPQQQQQQYNQSGMPIQNQQQFTYYIRKAYTDSNQYINPNIRNINNFQRSNSLYNYNDRRINQPSYDPLTAQFQRLSMTPPIPIPPQQQQQQQPYSPVTSSPLARSSSSTNSGHKNVYYSSQSPPLQPPSSPSSMMSNGTPPLPPSTVPLISSPLIQQQQQQQQDDNNRMTPTKGILSDSILWIPKNQMNCRTLQMKLDSNPEVSVPLLLSNLSDSFVEIIMDPFGNYLFQKIIDYCNDDQIFMILKNIQIQLVTASKDQHGSRSIQALIKKCHLLTQFELIKTNIQDHVYELSIDPHGNHVLQLCIEKFPEDMSLFIFDLVENHVIDISKTKFGCYVVQKCYEIGNQSRKDKIADIIINSSSTIISEPYGNYALQYIIENGPVIYSHSVYELIKGKIVELSMQKYSSNVLEKLILKNDKDIQSSIVNEITIDQSTLTTVAEHRFGIYVVRRLLKSSLPDILTVFQEKFDPVYNAMKSNPRDKKNLEALEKPVD